MWWFDDGNGMGLRRPGTPSGREIVARGITSATQGRSFDSATTRTCSHAFAMPQNTLNLEKQVVRQGLRFVRELNDRKFSYMEQVEKKLAIFHDSRRNSDVDNIHSISYGYQAPRHFLNF